MGLLAEVKNQRWMGTLNKFMFGVRKFCRIKDSVGSQKIFLPKNIRSHCIPIIAKRRSKGILFFNNKMESAVKISIIDFLFIGLLIMVIKN